MVSREKVNKTEILAPLKQAPPRMDPAFYKRDFRIDEEPDSFPDPRLEPYNP